MLTLISIDTEVEAQLLWLSLNQRPDQPGNLSGVIRKLVSDACKQLLDSGGSEKWRPGGLRRGSADAR